MPHHCPATTREPGGTAVGERVRDLVLHQPMSARTETLLMFAARCGAQIDIEGGYVIARAKKGLRGGEIVFPKVTVGGTHTALMAAVLASGTTVIENADRKSVV